MALLVAAPWPGNVRQLLNLLEQAVALATTSRHPGVARAGRAARGRERAGAVRGGAQDVRARLSRAAPQDHGGNVTQAAHLAKRNRTEFYKLLQRHRLEPAMFKEGKAS